MKGEEIAHDEVSIDQLREEQEQAARKTKEAEVKIAEADRLQEKGKKIESANKTEETSKATASMVPKKRFSDGKK